MKAVIDKLHAAGIQAGLHSYAMFMDKACSYVAPVPDPRLGKDGTFTLAAELPPDTRLVPVNESTVDMSTTTGFLRRNSVTLQIDDELITYAGVTKEPPLHSPSAPAALMARDCGPREGGSGPSLARVFRTIRTRRRLDVV